MTCWTDLLGVPFELAQVDAGGVSTRALQAGNGQDVIFLHGTSGHLEAFTRNIKAHVEAGFRCHAIDLLGHGFTSKPDGNYEIPRYVDHVLAYMDAVGAPQASIVGESIGGWIAARLASDHSEKVASLILVAPGGTKANPAVMERLKTSTWEAVESDDPRLTRKRLELLMYDPVNVTDELVEVRHRIYRQPEFKAHLDGLLCLQEMEIRQRNLLTVEQMGKIKAPTLIVWGHENPFGDVPEAKAMNEAIPGSQLILFERCGHWPQHEHASRFNSISTRFLKTGQVVDPGLL
jgi:2-hydroxy-6-oxonona-2,4-dienedioate hydrolase